MDAQTVQQVSASGITDNVQFSDWHLQGIDDESEGECIQASGINKWCEKQM